MIMNSVHTLSHLTFTLHVFWILYLFSITGHVIP